eukprot:Polyplicarium_translucidae@DN1870_c0_g1_i2.p1
MRAPASRIRRVSKARISAALPARGQAATRKCRAQLPTREALRAFSLPSFRIRLACYRSRLRPASVSPALHLRSSALPRKSCGARRRKVRESFTTGPVFDRHRTNKYPSRSGWMPLVDKRVVGVPMATSSLDESNLPPILPATWPETEEPPEPSLCLEQLHDLSEPVPLIRVDKIDGREFLKIGEEARKWLEGTGNKKVVVSAMTGPYRTGKSHLLNLIVDAGRQIGTSRFEVGSSIRACTEGVWMWGLSLSADAVHLLLDFEGMSDLLRTPERDTRILTLALLVSDYVIYNTKGVIDESGIQNLKSISRLADHVRRSHSPSRRREVEREDDPRAIGRRVSLSRYLGHQHWIPPALLWVLRDFSLLLRDAQGCSISPNEYLELALEEPCDEGFRSGIRDARSDIRSFFSKRECVALVQPVIDEDDLQRLPSLHDRDLRPQFRNQVASLRRKIFHDSALHAKSHFAMSGRGFVRLLGRYVDALNANELPNVHWTWDTLQKDECEIAVVTAINEYKSSLGELSGATALPCHPDELYDRLGELRRRTTRRYGELAFGEQHVVAEHQLHLLSQIDVAENRKIEENAVLCDGHAREMLDDLCRPIEGRLRELEYSDLDGLREDIRDMGARFHEKAPLSEAAKRAAVADRTATLLNQGLNSIMQHQKNLLNEQLIAAQEIAGRSQDIEPNEEWAARQLELEEEVNRLRASVADMDETMESRKGMMDSVCRELSFQREENAKLEERIAEKQNVLTKLRQELAKKKSSKCCGLV